MAYLGKMYKVKEKGITTVIEELKQSLTAKAEKITRYENRTKQFKQNWLFEENQRRFYSEIEGKSNRSAAVPDHWESI